jgi:hypothetical protein
MKVIADGKTYLLVPAPFKADKMCRMCVNLHRSRMCKAFNDAATEQHGQECGTSSDPDIRIYIPDEPEAIAEWAAARMEKT